MGLQHAIHDIGPTPHEAAPGAKCVSGATISAPSPRPAGGARGILSSFRGALRPRPRGGWSAWRVTAVAILTYVVAVNVSYFFVLKPIWSRLNALVEKKSVIQDFLVVRESAAAVSTFKDGLMHGDQRMTVVAEFEDLGRDAGLRMVGEPGLLPPQELSKKLMEYPVEIDLRGSYHEVGEFLSLLEASPRCPLIRQIEVTAGAGGSSQCDVRLRMGIVSWAE